MNLLTEHTFGGLVKDSFAVYFQNFLPIFVIYILPLFPVQVWYDYAVSVKALDQILPHSFLSSFVEILLIAPITVAVSDICLGNKPSVKRAYAVIFGGLLWRYLWTSVVLYLPLMFGFVLMMVLGKISPYIFIFGLVPASLFYALFMFAIQVALLEGSSGWAALARSKELGQGFYVRNFLVFIVVFVAVVLLHEAFSGVLLHVIHEPIVLTLVRTFVWALFGPISVILVIVIYYDMRVRKEAYDSTMLTQDLMR